MRERRSNRFEVDEETRKQSQMSTTHETNQSQESLAEREKMLLNMSPYTPKEVASVELNTATPKQASPYDHYNPLFPWTHPLHLQPVPYLHRPRPPFYVYQRPILLPVLPHDSDLSKLSPRGYQINNRPVINNNPYQLDSQVNFPSLTAGNKKPTRRELRNSHLRNNLVGHEPVMQEQDLPQPPPVGLEPLMQEQDLPQPPPVGLEPVMQEQDLPQPPPVGHEPVMQEPNLPQPPPVGVEPVMQEENDFMRQQNRFLTDGVFQHYRFSGRRMPSFRELCTEKEEPLNKKHPR